MPAVTVAEDLEDTSSVSPTRDRLELSDYVESKVQAL